MSLEVLRERLRDAGQAHLLDDLDRLAPDVRKKLIAFAEGTDFAHLNRVLEASLALLQGNAAPANGGGSDSLAPVVTPPPIESILDVDVQRDAEVTSGTRGDYHAYEDAGFRLIRQGKTAVILMAGGSGTRLGVPYPKGLFSYDHEPSCSEHAATELIQQRTKSLFQFHCERLRKAEALAQAPCAGTATGGSASGKIHLLVMTSDQNREETENFFHSHHFFGLDEDQVTFFTQTSLPVYAADLVEGDGDAAGHPTHRVLMHDEGVPLLAPGGNGGIYESLAFRTREDSSDNARDESALDILERRGVLYVQIFSVDNLLAKIGDPVFFGFTEARGCHVTVKTTPKVSPDERVGVFAKTDGKWGVVEYTELGQERANLRRPSSSADKNTPRAGELLFNCANIASHCVSVTFLKFAAVQMKKEVLYHAAVKKVKVEKGAKERMGIKLEAFIFDMFRYCNDAVVDTFASDSQAPSQQQQFVDRFGILQVNRAAEFAPIKNATEAAKTDNPETAALLYLHLTTRWVRDTLQRRLKQLNDQRKPDDDASRQRVREALILLVDPSTTVNSGEGNVFVEVAPLVSYAGEGLERYTNFLLTAIPDAARTSQRHVVVLLDENVKPDAQCGL